MKMFSRSDRRSHYSKYGFMNLLAWLLVYLVIGPFLDAAPNAQHLMSGLLTIVLLAALGTMNQQSSMLRYSVGFLVLAVGLIWLQSLNYLDSWVGASSLGIVLFLSPLVYVFGKHIFTTKEVTGNLLCCALCLYLIIGMFWGGLFALLESVQPMSFAGHLLEGAETYQQKQHHLEYFSYVTLSTLGYGDITPQTRAAAALCQAEAIVGQFFAMVIVARLVGIQVSQQAHRES